MSKVTSKISEHFIQARALRADLMAATAVWVPRRDVILDWLDGFMRRAEIPAYALGETEADDLHQLELFLRRKKVPVVA